MNSIWRERLRLPALVVVTLAGAALALMVGYSIPSQPMLVMLTVVGLFVTVAALVNPILLPLLAMPLIVVVQRFGVGALEMTISDWVLGLAFWPAVIFARRPFSPELRRLLWLNVVYQAMTLFTLVANPFTANTVEWFHAWLLVSGALVVGWAVGAAGQARLGISLFLVTCLLLAAPTIAQGLLQYSRGHFDEVYPRWPWPMHKNFIGNLLGIAAVVVYARPSWLGWARRAAVPAFLIFVTVILMSQSRQAIAGLALGLLVISLRQYSERRRFIWVIALVVPMVYVILEVIRDQIASGNLHNSFFQRLTWYADTLRIWQESPIFGHGLRYWTQSGAPGAFQPPNAFLEVSASTGLVGLLGFLALWAGCLVVLWRMDPTYGTLALALAVSRLGQSQFDLFWVSISVSAPFLLIGVCLGAASLRASSRTAEERQVRVAEGARAEVAR